MLIRYYGPVGVTSGYGRAANETCMAILAAGLELEICAYTPPGGENLLRTRYLPLATCVRDDVNPPKPNPDVVIVHTLPMDCAKVLEATRIRQLYPAAHCVAYTTWEGVSVPPPEILKAIAAFDSLWIPSGVSGWGGGLSFRGGRIPIFVVPHAYDDTGALPLENRAMGSQPKRPRAPGAPATDPYRFYYIGAWTVRKNPEGLIRAYLRAFRKEDPVELVIHSAFAPAPAAHLAAIAASGRNPSELPQITFTTQYMNDEDLTDLHRSCHCFVTMTRGECWNLPCFDAMLARRHIIAPQTMGHEDYLTGTSWWEVPVRQVPASGEVRIVERPDTPPGQVATQYQGTPGLTVLADWLEPDVLSMASLMTKAFRGRVADLSVTYDPSKRYGRMSIGNWIREILSKGVSK